MLKALQVFSSKSNYQILPDYSVRLKISCYNYLLVLKATYHIDMSTIHVISD